MKGRDVKGRGSEKVEKGKGEMEYEELVNND